jgi:predicted GNAT superfamily acetyltransferase
MGADEAWALANEAAQASGVVLRPLSTVEDLQGVGGVIDAVWGPDAMPPALLRAFQHAGGVLVGAFAGREQVGFVLGFLGWEDGLHLHSHMLAVLPDRRLRGVGRALKLAQRASCLDRGIAQVRWTYDPLLAGNARFNLNLLGVVATAFLRDFYGAMPDRLNRGERSDRFEVRWDLASDRARHALEGDVSLEGGDLPSILDARGEPALPEPVLLQSPIGAGCTVSIPKDHLSLRSRDPALSARWRDAAAAAFDRCFAANLVATRVDPEGRYVFEPARELP